MASRKLASICYLCEAAGTLGTRRPTRLPRILPAQRRQLSSSILRHRSSSMLNGSYRVTLLRLPNLTLRTTTYRHYAHTSNGNDDPGMTTTAKEEQQQTTLIEAAIDTAYTSSDISSLDNLKAAIERNVFQEADKILPREDQVIDALGALQRLAIGQMASEGTKSTESHLSEGSAEAILSLAGGASASTKQRQGAGAAGKGDEVIEGTLTASAKAQMAAKENPPIHPVMDVAYNILSYPAVFISPNVLSAYVALAATVRDPSTIPPIFRKYANKPMLSSPDAKPHKPNPKAAKYAIPLDIAKAALEVAIEARNLPKALEIIEGSVGAKAFLRRKTMTQVVPFWTLCGVVPLGLWKFASWLATFDNNFLHSTATGWAFALLCCYTVYTGTIGMTALMTYNDHMLRVTWISGFPLRQRWYLEEQRRMADRVAMAWGFQNAQEWGLESGWEWQYLRHWCGVRGMIVDDTTVLEAKEIRIGGH